jgi:hypothetical protein
LKDKAQKIQAEYDVQMAELQKKQDKMDIVMKMVGDL